MKISSLFSRLRLRYKDNIEEKEYHQLQAPLTLDFSKYLFLCIGLFFIPLTARYFQKQLYPQSYIGIVLVVVAFLILLFRRKFGCFLEYISVIYVTIAVALVIVNANILIDKITALEAFFMGYAASQMHRLVDYRIVSFLFVLVFNIAFTIVNFTVIGVPDVSLILVILFLEFFPVILSYKSEQADRILFDSLYKSKTHLLKFKQLLTENLPNQVAIFTKDFSGVYFLNDSFRNNFRSDSIKKVKQSVCNLVVENEDLEKNKTLCQLLDHNQHSHLQKIKFLDIMDLISQKFDLLKENKTICLQVTEYTDSSCTYPSQIDNIEDPQKVPITNRNGFKEENELLAETTDENQPKDSKSGKKRVYRVTLFPLLWDNDEAIALLFDDITYENTISELKIADRNKDLVIAMISHELKTPLNGMLGLIDIVKKILKEVVILKQLEDSDKSNVFAYLEACKSSSLLLLNLVNSVLDFSHISRNKLKLILHRFHISDQLNKIKSLYEHFCRIKGLYLNIDIAPNVPPAIKTDKTRLNQVIINLVGNAFKFTFQGGVTIKVTLEAQAPCQIKFAVEDTGVGMTKEEQERLFKLFKRPKEQDAKKNTQGVGLGLTISNALAIALNPTIKAGIQVESELDKGTTFSFLVQDEMGVEDDQNGSMFDNESFTNMNENTEPLKILEQLNMYTKTKEKNDLAVLNELKKLEKVESSNDKMKERPWCLIVDDNPFNLMVASKVMEERNYKIKTAMNGNQAIEAAIAHHADDKTFKVVLMDCQMPVMDGYEATKILTTMMKNGDIDEYPIIAFTANVRDEHHEKLCKESGMSGHIGKPFQGEDLDTVLREVANKKRKSEVIIKDENKKKNSKVNLIENVIDYFCYF